MEEDRIHNPCPCSGKKPACKTTPLGSFPGYQPCEKLDPQWVDAYTEIKLDPENPTGIILDTSWGEVKLDLKFIVKAGETITHLELAPEENPTVLRYKNETGDYECIAGDELSRIISLHLLKDVDQTTPPSDGIVYQYNETTNLFEPFDLKNFVTNTNLTIGRLQAQINALTNRITDIENIIPFYPEDKTMKLARGVINLYSDKNVVVDSQGIATSLDKSHGIYTHDLDTEVYGDRIAG